jgi:glycosyltransferase involved in cell wall biosynthesis
MRILHVSDRLTDRGGAHWHLRSVIERLRGLGHEVALAAGTRDDGVVPPCALHVVPGLEARARQAADLARVLDAVRPDVVHLHTVVNPAVLDWAGGLPALVTVQDHRYFCPAHGKWTAAGHVCREPMKAETCAACFSDDRYFRDVYALTEERLGAIRGLPIVVLSRYMKSELIAVGVEASRIAVVPPFVHGLDAHAPPDGPPWVLFAGRLAAGKGVREAVEAWRGSGLDLPLVFAGTGPLRASLEDQGLSVLGWVPHARMSSVYRRARALLMPSRWQEPFGIVGLEAASLGTPVVAWQSGGVAEWHPGGPLLVPWGDVAGLSEALREAVAGPRAEAPAGFDPDALMRRLMDVYEAVQRGRTEGLGSEDRQDEP